MPRDRRSAFEVPLPALRKIATDGAIFALILAALFVGGMAVRA